MRTWPIALALLCGAVAAHAQATADPQDPPLPGANPATTTPDEGRPLNIDRTGLASRGGPNPTGSDKTYSATIGSSIGSPISPTIGPR